MANFGNMLRVDGKQNSPGLKEIGYFALKDDIETWPARKANPASAAEENTLAGTFAMKTGKFFHKLFSSEGNAKVEGESQGELDNETHLQKANFYNPYLDDDELAFGKLAKNHDLVFIFIERDGERRVLGNPNWRTKTKVTDSTGDENTSKKGITVEVETTDIGPAPRYDGAIPLDGSQEPPLS